MLLNWINFELQPLWIGFIWFGVFILHYKLNAGYYVRKILRIKQTKPVKIIDCFPCQSFWTSLIITFNPLTAVLVYFMAQSTEK